MASPTPSPARPASSPNPAPGPAPGPVTRPAVRPVVLLILDGFGCRPAAPDNAICAARKPHWGRCWPRYPHTTIDASEKWVGLPDGQMGNSEVGHLNIGAGRVVYQDFTRIDAAIASGEFARNPVLADAIAHGARRAAARCTCSACSRPGGVHSHEPHIAAMVDLAASARRAAVCVHAFLDGRDTPPKSAEASLAALEAKCCAGSPARASRRSSAATSRWTATSAGTASSRPTTLIVDGARRTTAPTARRGARGRLRARRDRRVRQPTAIVPPAARRSGMRRRRRRRVHELPRRPRAPAHPRAHRPAFDGFARARRAAGSAATCTLTSYGEDFAHLPVAFAPQSDGATASASTSPQLGLTQLRIAETEKYAHVTYFFNGGVETPYPGEDRVLVPSPKVATYDLKPEMSAREVTDRLVAAIGSRQVRRHRLQLRQRRHGRPHRHPRRRDRARSRRSTRASAASSRRCSAAGGEVLITADHGNAEMMLDPTTGQPHTAHTLNLVPLLYVGRTGAPAPTAARCATSRRRCSR